ncbi:MAG TPA: ABC transporter ATP-binding protein [Verrucomicrobiae bacterium]|nr:ABC transporter ATP-binding protein [Verrucomicrobiae bacterium]
MTEDNHSLLRVEGLTVDFDAGKPTSHRALDGVSLSIGEGEVLGLVGESGSGKTVLSHSILGLLPQNGRIVSGRISWQGRQVQGLSEESLRPIRGKELAMIFQDPQASLNPVYRVGHQVEWVLKLHRNLVGDAARAEVLRLLDAVHLREPDRCYRCYPHQLSGGMCQRVMIAMALACRPKLLIADEPTSALDVTTQCEILTLLAEVRHEFGMTLLFISHDIRAVSALCDRVAVMLAGQIVETGVPNTILHEPTHPYTRRLVYSSDVRIDCPGSSSNRHNNMGENLKPGSAKLREAPCQP